MITSNQVYGVNLQLSNHSGVLIPIFILASLQLEGVAEVSQPFEFLGILQFIVIHLETHSHTSHRGEASVQHTSKLNDRKLTLRVSYPFLR